MRKMAKVRHRKNYRKTDAIKSISQFNGSLAYCNLPSRTNHDLCYQSIIIFIMRRTWNVKPPPVLEKRNWIFLTMTETLSSQMHKRKHYLINLNLIQINIYFQWLIKPKSYLNIQYGKFEWLNNLFTCKDSIKFLYGI